MAAEDKDTEETQEPQDAADGKDMTSNQKSDDMDRIDSEGAIGAGLRSLYQNIVDEPLPDDMLSLLDQLNDVADGSDDNSARESN